MINHVTFPGLGLSFTVNRIAFTLFGIPIYWYGLLIATGMGLALLFAFHYAKEFGLNVDRMIDVIMVSTIGAIIGARAYYVIFAPFPYQSFWEIINIRDGGIAIYGGIMGAVVVGLLACKWRKVPVLPMLDLASMGFLIGQGIGRWGNFTNQEAFGTNTTRAWGMLSEGTSRYLASMQSTLAQSGISVNPALPVHPTFLYESLWCALGFILLYRFMKHRRYDGQIALIYMGWYGAGRAVIEGLRTDSLVAGGIRMSQVVGILSAVIAICLLLFFYLKKRDDVLARRQNDGVHH